MFEYPIKKIIQGLHDQDINAALNIFVVGHHFFAEGIPVL